MANKKLIRNIIEQALSNLKRDMDQYLREKRRRGTPMSYGDALERLERVVLRPERVADRKSQCLQRGMNPKILEDAWREAIARLRRDSDN